MTIEKKPFVHVQITWDLWDWMEKGPLRETGGTGKAGYLRRLLIEKKKESDRATKKEAVSNGQA